MKKFIRKISVFFFIVLLLYPFLIIVQAELFGLNQKNLKFIPNKSWTKTTLNEALNYQDIDFLFIGSSHAYRGYDIRLFDKLGKSFNLGTTSQTPLQSYFLLKKYINILRPKYVIIDIYFPLFESDGIESSIDIISNFFSFDNFNLLFLNPNPVVLNTLIYSNYYYILKKDYNKQNKYSNKFDKYITGGFVERNIDFYNSKETLPRKNIKINPRQIKAFENILTLLENRRIKFIIVHSPITKNEYLSYLNTLELNKYFNSKGFYLNFNEMPLPLNDNIHFYDRHHLNEYGVYLFNRYLIEYLINIFPELKSKSLISFK